MVIELTMPRLSDTMEKGTIIKWNVQEGDHVSAGDAVADVETDKATMEMQVYDDGTIGRILVEEGRTVEVGTVIAVLAERGDDVAAVAEAAASAARKGPGAEAPAAAPSAPAGAPPRPAAEPREVREAAAAPQEPGDGRMRISPVARRVAEEHGMDPATLHGSGPGGRIIKRDVLRAVEASAETAAAIPPSARRALQPTRVEPAAQLVPSEVPEDRVVPLSSMRQTIARRLLESTRTIPHYQVSATFDADPLLQLRATLNEQLDSQGVKLSINDFLVRACSLALRRHPELNSSWENDHLRIHADINVGLAIAIPTERGGGLVVGTLLDADRKSLRAISEESVRLARKARTRGLSSEEMAGSTFVISNLGMYGVDSFTAIINPPNTAILAVGAALKRPVVRGDQLVIGHEMTATLSLDHRVIDGAVAAEYMRTLRGLIESPATLLV
jgi:pyruvate dehydrogenase E2 component (dihydrolipoamide acetyltransferase)